MWWTDAITRLLTAFAPFVWPALVLFIVLYFRKPIKDRLEAVRELDWKNKVVRFGDERTDSLGGKHLPAAPTDSASVPTETGFASGAKWNNTGNVYWLGHDLIWTSQVALRAAPKSELLRGLRQAQYHLKHLGLVDLGAKLSSIIDEVESTSEPAMSADWRKTFSAKVSRFVSDVGALAAKNQPDFEKDVAK